MKALRAAGHPELIRQDVGELIVGASDDGTVPPSWDPARPCAHAKPPTEHSHTFWPDGRFNSYDEHGQQVDDGPWRIVDDRHFSIGDSTFAYTIADNTLSFSPVVPTPCPAECRAALGWMYAVSYPGQRWTRVISGAHVPGATAP